MAVYHGFNKGQTMMNLEQIEVDQKTKFWNLYNDAVNDLKILRRKKPT